MFKMIASLKACWWARRLRNRDPFVRSTAAVELGKLGLKGLEGILRALERPLDSGASMIDYESQFVVSALARTGRLSLQRLIGQLQSESIEVRRSVAQALGEIRDVAAVEPLLRLLDDPQTRIQAARSLGKIGDKRATVPLVGLWNEGHREVIDPLCEIDDHRSAPALTQALDCLWDCSKVVKHLGKMGDAQDFEKIHQWLQVQEANLKAHERERSVLGDQEYYRQRKLRIEAVNEAFRVLAKASHEKSIPTITNWLRTGHAGTHEEATRALNSFGAKAIPVCCDLLATHADKLGLEVLSLMICYHSPGVSTEHLIDALVPLLQSSAHNRSLIADFLQTRCKWSPNTDAEKAAVLVARGAFSEAAALGSPGVHALIAALLIDVDFTRSSPPLFLTGAWLRRREAGKALAAIDHPLVLPALTLAKDVEALASLGPIAGDALMSLDKDLATIAALAKIGDSRAIPFLTGLLCGRSQVERQMAAKALPLLGWQPVTKAEHALVALSHGSAEGLINAGMSGLLPLCHLLFWPPSHEKKDGSHIYELKLLSSAVLDLLRADDESVSIEDLERLTQAPDHSVSHHVETDAHLETYRVDSVVTSFEPLRQAAREALNRRARH